MTVSFLRSFNRSLLLLGLLECTGCSRGTNTGGSCPLEVCEEPIQLIGSDGTTYRGRVWPDVNIATSDYAQSLPNPPMAELSFAGGEVSASDAGCQDTGGRLQVQVFVSTADSSMDASGTLHVHSAPRDDIFAAGPGYIYDPPIPGWAVDLTLTADGQLTATLSVESSDSLDAGTAVRELRLSGRIQPECGASMPVSGGGTFKFPCWQLTSCGPCSPSGCLN